MDKNADGTAYCAPNQQFYYVMNNYPNSYIDFIDIYNDTSLNNFSSDIEKGAITELSQMMISFTYFD